MDWKNILGLIGIIYLVIYSMSLIINTSFNVRRIKEDIQQIKQDLSEIKRKLK
jgi:hypothetical protein